jgi:hypothetical protein
MGDAGLPRWYENSWVIIAAIVVFFPVGLYLMWRYAAWSQWWKWGVTGTIALLLISGLIGSALEEGPSAEELAANEATETHEALEQERKETEEARVAAREQATADARATAERQEELREARAEAAEETAEAERHQRQLDRERAEEAQAEAAATFAAALATSRRQAVVDATVAGCRFAIATLADSMTPSLTEEFGDDECLGLGEQAVRDVEEAFYSVYGDDIDPWLVEDHDYAAENAFAFFDGCTRMAFDIDDAAFRQGVRLAPSYSEMTALCDEASENW